MRGGSRRKGARDAGTQSPRARVGSPALCVPAPPGEGSVPAAGLWAKGAVCRCHSLRRRGLREGGGSQCPGAGLGAARTPLLLHPQGGSELVWLPRQGRVGPPRPGDVSGQQRESLIGSCVL